MAAFVPLLFFLCHHIYLVYACVQVCAWNSEANVGELVLYYHPESGERTLGSRLHSKYLYLLGHSMATFVLLKEV